MTMPAPVIQTGLIVVDLQHAFRPPAHIVDGIKAIIKNYDIVIATQFLNRKWSMYETELGYDQCHIGSREADIVTALRPKVVFDRFTYGLQQVHIDRLRDFPVKRWDIVGCDTEACVLGTCYNLWDGNIRFRVLKDLCHSSGGQDLHGAALKIMKRSFGEKNLVESRHI